MRKVIGSRELKTRLGTYLQQVQAGVTIVVTDRGLPIAELRPLASDTKGEEARLAELTALGVLSRQSDQSLASFRAVRSTGRSLAEAISEDREERM